MGLSRVTWTAVAATLAFCGSAGADQVWYGGVQYENVTVESINEKTVSFIFQQRQVIKANDPAMRIEIEGFDAFNEAEQLLASKEYAKARLVYEVAADKAGTDLQKQLVKMRSPLAKNPKPVPAAKPATQPAATKRPGPAPPPHDIIKNPPRKQPETQPGTQSEKQPETQPEAQPEKPPESLADVVVPGAHYSSAATQPVEIVKPEDPEANVNTLSSPDEMLRAVANPPKSPDKSPAWETMTAIQRDEARRQYEKELALWRKAHDYHKERVTWSLRFQSVRLTKDGLSLFLLADTKDGAVVGANFAKNNQAVLSAIKKGQSISLSGTIREYTGGSPRDAKEDWFTANPELSSDVLLDDPSIKTDE